MPIDTCTFVSWKCERWNTRRNSNKKFCRNENKGFARAWQRHLSGIRFIYCYFVSCSIESEVLRLFFRYNVLNTYKKNESRFFANVWSSAEGKKMPRLKKIEWSEYFSPDLVHNPAYKCVLRTYLCDTNI